MADKAPNKKEKENATIQVAEQQMKKQVVQEKAMPDKTSALEAGKKDLVDALQRLQAEFENYRKRIEKEKQQCVRIGKAGAISALLAVLDSFDAAVEKLKKEKTLDSGLELLHKQFLQAMQKLGVQEISALGKQFNHETMDCVMQGNDSAREDGIVLEEFQKGYVLDGIVLRHAKVKVNKQTGKEKNACATEKIVDKK